MRFASFYLIWLEEEGQQGWPIVVIAVDSLPDKPTFLNTCLNNPNFLFGLFELRLNIFSREQIELFIEERQEGLMLKLLKSVRCYPMDLWFGVLRISHCQYILGLWAL